MASLLLLTLGLSALKIKQHRAEKKAKKAMVQGWQESDYSAASSSSATRTATMVGGPLGGAKEKVTGRRKRRMDGEEGSARREFEERYGRRGSVSASVNGDGEDEMPPPSYEEAVGGRG